MVPEIEGAVATAAARTRPFDLPLGGFGAFPSLRQPQVLWLRAEATPELRCLKQDLEWDFAPLGFERETRAFQPHLTLGRSSPGAGAGDFRLLEPLLQSLDYQAAPHITVIELMRSRQTGAGVTYERIATVPLG
jgi:2'-5' RNA ligase